MALKRNGKLWASGCSATPFWSIGTHKNVLKTKRKTAAAIPAPALPLPGNGVASVAVQSQTVMVRSAMVMDCPVAPNNMSLRRPSYGERDRYKWVIRVRKGRSRERTDLLDGEDGNP